MPQWFVIAKFSLSFLWILTGFSSLFFSPDIGYQILAKGGLTGTLADVLVYSGSVINIALGLWMLTSKWIQVCCVLQIVVIVVYTALLSIIDASFWLDPFGPITKNIPVLVLIWAVISEIQQNLRTES